MTLQEWYQRVTSSFATANIENSAQEARWLIEAALKKEAGFVRLYPTYLPSLQETQIIESWVSRRLMGEPLSRIKGVREFWSLPFHLSAETLDPRPETEILIEGVLRWLGKRKSGPLHILDLGTGSGSILISLLHECPQATGIGIDISEKALDTARINAEQNKVDSRITFAQGNWGEALVDAFDIIVSNPPYIPLTDKPTLDNHVLNFDPPHGTLRGRGWSYGLSASLP